MASYGYEEYDEAYATVREYQPFDPKLDSEMLRKSMKGLGTDEQAIIDVLGFRTNAQRQYISSTYKTNFGRDLEDDLKSELGGKFEDLIIALMMPTLEFLTVQLHKAICGLGTDEDTLIEILASSNNQEIQALNSFYQEKYDKSLEDDLIGETSGDFRRLLVSLLQGGRDETPYAVRDLALADAQALVDAGEGSWGTDESVFNQILVTKSYQQLIAMFQEYEKINGNTIEHSISNETSGDLQTGLLSIVKCIRNKPGFFAERLYNAMSGAGTDDNTLIRVVVNRAEIDMALIKQEFEKDYGRTLEHFIAGDTSGDYKRMLLAIIQ